MLWNPEIESPASIAIIGGGHLAIEAALYARFLGYHVDLFEAWRLAGRMLEANEPPGCSWREATSSLGRAALEAQGVATELFQQDSIPDLRTWVDEYLFPAGTYRSYLRQHPYSLAGALHQQTSYRHRASRFVSGRAAGSSGG